MITDKLVLCVIVLLTRIASDFPKKKFGITKTILVKLINDHYFTFAISESIKMALSFIDDKGTNSFSAATRRGFFFPYLLDRYMRKFLFLVYTPALTRKKKIFLILLLIM